MAFTVAAASLLAVILTIPSIIVYLLHHAFRLKHHPDEPPLIPQRPPLIGHILGLLRHGHPYLERLSQRYSDLPIYTLHAFLTRIYVINSPELVLAVQKNAKNLSFNPFIIAMMPRLFAVTGLDVDIASRNHDMEDGHWGFLPEVHSSTYASLSPGDDLDGMIATMLNAMLGYIDELSDAAHAHGTQIDLYAWIRRTVTASSTLAAYGPCSPFAHDPTLCAAFWAFESQLTSLLIGILPRLTARKAYLARARIAAAMKQYFSCNGHLHASGLVRTRYETGQRHGLSSDALAVFELGDCIGVLINSVPTIFWLLHHIYTSPPLLLSLRAELTAAFPAPGAVPVHALQETCPLLAAIYKEVLRHRAHHSSSRYVKADTRLLGKHLLKEGGIIQIPSSALHLNAQLWGADASEFSPARFLRGGGLSAASSTTSLQSSTASGCDTPGGAERSSGSYAAKKTRFRAFGGGKTLCPGRHFATATILATCAMVVRRLDVLPVGGRWVDVEQAEGRLASTIPPPEGDVRVVIRKRDDGVEGDGKWGWDFGGRVGRFEA